MSLLDEPINFDEVFSAPVLLGAGLGIAASYSLFRSPSLAQILGVSMLGGLGGYYLRAGGGSGLSAPAPRLPSISQPSLPTFDFGSIGQAVQDKLSQVFHHPPSQPSPGAGNYGGSPVVITPPVNLMSPETAYKLVQQGKYHTDVKNAKLSRFYNWSDLMVSSSINDANRKSIPLSAYQNAAKLGKALDKLVQATGGKKITANSWHRIQTRSSNHTTGGAVDLGGSLSYAYIKNTLYPAARHITDFKGVGYPTKATHRSLHLDILENHGCPANMQFDFVDNGDGNYPGACKPVLKAAKPAPKPSILPKPGSIPVAPAPAPRTPFIPFPIFLPPSPTAPVVPPGNI